MSLKVKLISCISAVVLVIGLMIFGVFSIERASVNLGGTVSFEATNVYCKITGQITGAEESPVTPQELNYSANSEPTEEQLASWNNDLNFTEDAQAIEIEVTVENLASRELIVSVEDLTTTSNNVIRSMSKTVGEASEGYTSGSLYTIPASTGEGSANTSKATFTLKLEVDDPNNSASATYNYHVNLRDESVPVIIDDNNGSDNMGSITIEDENGDGKIEAGEEVTVTADPNTGSGFIGWQDENGIVVSEDEEFTFTAGEDFSNLTALFNKTITSSFKDEATTSPLTYTIYNEAEVAEVTGCDAGAVDVTIPETITREGKTYIVYKIKDATSSSNGAFYQTRSTIESVTISDKITKIGEYAFQSCSNLTEIIWGENVREIGGYAFESCSGLTNLILPERLTKFGDRAFFYCSNLNDITIPSSLTSITYNVFGIFDGCENLKTINVDKNNMSFCDIDGILFNKDKTKIIKYPQAKTEATYIIPSSVTSVENSAFSNCSSLTSITILNGVTSIGSNAFKDCSSLTSITIPSSVTNIVSSSFAPFSGCSNLTEVIIDSEEIYKDITEQDKPGRLIYYAQTIRVLKTIDDGSNTFLNGYDKSEGSGEYADYNIYTPPVEVTQNSIIYRLHNSTLTADVAGCESTLSGDVVIPSSISYDSKTYSVTIIEERAFRNNRNITSVTIPDTITSINGEYVFAFCDNLVSVIFTGSSKITKIPQHTFYYCDALKNINIPSSVTSIGSYAFGGCSSLTSITIPSDVTSIGSYAFSNCSSLTTITIPSNVTKVYEGTFSGCSSLTEINVDENNASFCDVDGVLFNKAKTEILKYPVAKVATTYDILESVTIIGSYAFDGCSNLTSITIPTGVTSIGYHAFSNCSSLTTITIPSSVTSIEYYAFQNCSSLTSITIPSGVTIIGVDEFNGCTNLKTVYCDSVEGYTSADSNNSSSSSHLFDNADTVYVLASIRDGGATNYYLNDTTIFNIPSTTKNVNGQDYYVYTRK